MENSGGHDSGRSHDCGHKNIIISVNRAFKIITGHYRTEDPHQSYRKKVQRYTGEERSLFEDLRYVLFLGTNSFADAFKERFIKTSPQPELTQQVKLAMAVGAEATLKKLAQAIDCRIDHFRKSLRISKADKMNRDLMLYLLWHSGLYTNQQIGEMFGLSYSSVSRRAALTRKRIREDVNLKKKVQQLSDLIKV